MRRIDDIALWELFEGCVKTGSLAKAALAQNMELSAASRLMAALEHEIGFALLDRSVRPAAPTAAAQRLCPAARKIVRARRDAQTLICAIAEEQRIARTTRHVCISLPVNLNRAEVLRALSEYERHAARLKIEVSADSGIPALLSGKTDISLASYSLDDPALFRQFIAHGFTFLMATQRYADRHGLPGSIDELCRHRLLNRFSANFSHSSRLENGKETHYLGPKHQILYGDASACREMLLAGEGIAIDINVGFVARELADGTVFPVLKGWHRAPWHYNVYCRASDANDPLIRELMALIGKRLFSDLSDQWRFWYRKFGLEDPAAQMPGA